MIGVLFIPIVLAVLLLIAAFEGKFGLSLDPKVRVTDTLTVVCTTILALALQYFFARRNTSERDQRDVAAQAINSVLASLQELRQWVSDSVTGTDLTTEQAQRIVFGFECCFDALLMLDLAFDYPDPQFLRSQVGDLAGLVLQSKRDVTGDDFPKRAITYADVEVLSTLRREIARKLSPLRRSIPSADSYIVLQWRRFWEMVDRDSPEW